MGIPFDHKSLEKTPVEVEALPFFHGERIIVDLGA
jgi:hypothetical protein